MSQLREFLSSSRPLLDPALARAAFHSLQYQGVLSE